jgi:tRNA 2-selenouridine synthase
MRPTHPTLRAEVPSIDAARLIALPRARYPRILDLRSPSEFADDALPGAENVPLFDDAERTLVGILYKQQSPDQAFALGIDIVTAKIEGLVASMARRVGWKESEVDLAENVRAMCRHGIGGLESGLRETPIDELPGGALLVHCWRGGLRSRSVAALLRSLGHEEVVCLSGGYRAYRRQVLEGLEAWQAPPTFVLRGLTGVGKTLVLRAIESLRPGWTVDLEGLAGHRSSLLGMVGLEPCSQKAFESRLFQRLRALEAGEPGIGPGDGRTPVIFEGESRKVGDVIIPRVPWSALRAGTSFELSASSERRIDVLMADYLADPAGRSQLAGQLALLEERMSGRPELVSMFAQGREREVVALLLEDYSDPLYRHSEKNHRYAATFDATDPRAAAQAIVSRIEESLGQTA